MPTLLIYCFIFVSNKPYFLLSEYLDIVRYYCTVRIQLSILHYSFSVKLYQHLDI